MIGPEGEEHWSIAKYDTIQPKKMFSGSDAFTNSEGEINPEMPRSKWSLTFEETSHGTMVTFDIVYDDLAQLEATIEMGFKEGLTTAMEGLDELLPSLKN